MPKSILFVDEEQFVHKALQRSFRKMRTEWDMHFAASPLEAAKTLVAEPVDVLVTETVFTGQSGVSLLKVVREKQPQMVRIILSGYSDNDVVLKTVDLAHQYLSKPCEDDDLRMTISRAFMVKDLMAQGALKDAVTKIEALPSLPSIYTELVNALQSEDASMQKVGEIIARDVSLTVKVLKLVNSSFFAIPQRVVLPSKAASLLGLDLVKAIVLTSGTFDKFEKVKFPGFTIDQLWEHATRTAAQAKCIAQAAGLEASAVETAFMAGMLHDIGKVLVAAYLPEQFSRILDLTRTRGASMFEAEEKVLGTSHAAVGGYLLGLWGLPEPIIAATAFHHTPGCQPAEDLSPLAIVHVADAMALADAETLNSDQPIDGLDYDYLERNGWIDQLPTWRSVCAEMEM
ncbi:MAG: response regulator [Desulfosarcinaceae bacterium]